MDIHYALAFIVPVDTSKCALKDKFGSFCRFFYYFFHFYRLIYFLADGSDVKMHCMIEKKIWQNLKEDETFFLKNEKLVENILFI